MLPNRLEFRKFLSHHTQFLRKLLTNAHWQHTVRTMKEESQDAGLSGSNPEEELTKSQKDN